MSETTDFNFSCLTHLGDLSIEQFLKEYWQKRPLLIPQAFSNFQSPISAEELAGLSLEEDVVSRLIIEDRKNRDWKLQHGPFDESIFTQLPENDWTLLVQHVDSLDPDVNSLLEAFRFIPNWRLDDIMVSYAPDGGGVGPHFDYFDVFLLQGEGQRRWKLGPKCDESSPLIPGQAMKILQSFKTEEEYVVNPGDLLYIPAQYAHWGEAVGESVTYSIGFRAPSHGEILLDFSQEVASDTNEQQRYSDPDLAPQPHRGEITQQAIKHFQSILSRYLNDEKALAQWIGQLSTQNSHAPDADELDEVLPLVDGEELLANTAVKISPFCRTAFSKTADANTSTNHIQLYIDGERFNCNESLSIAITEQHTILHDEYSVKEQQVLSELCDQGKLILA